MIEGKPSETAQIVCLMRALENFREKEKSLLKDKYAEYFLFGRFKFWLSFLTGIPGILFFPTYQWLYDAAVLRHALMDEVIRQNADKLPVVILGAGFDSRSLRLKEHLKNGIYEIDFEATQKMKHSILKKHGFNTDHVHYIKANFAEQKLEDILEPLNLKGKPVVLIWEGVTMYLEEGIVFDTIKTIGDYFGKGTIAIADFWMHSLPLPQFFRAPIKALFHILWDEPIIFGTSTEYLKERVAKMSGLTCEIYDYTALSKKFNTPRSIYSPFFTAVLKY